MVAMRGKIAQVHYCLSLRERQKASGQSSDCRLSSPGGGSDRNYDWRIDVATLRATRENKERQIEKKGRLKLCGMSGRGRMARC